MRCHVVFRLSIWTMWIKLYDTTTLQISLHSTSRSSRLSFRMDGQDGLEIGPAVKVLHVGISSYAFANNRSLSDEHYLKIVTSTMTEMAACIDEVHKCCKRWCALARARCSFVVCIKLTMDVTKHSSYIDGERWPLSYAFHTDPSWPARHRHTIMSIKDI